MYITGALYLSGSVGIGTNSPVSSLHINEISSSITLSKRVSALSSSVGALEWRNNHASTGVVWAKIDAVTLGTGGNPWDFSNITFSTWNGFNSLTERMRITNLGYVGIGTNNPESVTNFNTLQVDGTSGAMLRTGTSAYGGYVATIATADVMVLSNVRNPINGTFSNTGRAASVISLFGENANGYITFSTTGSNNTGPAERMRITSAGNVGIGTTSPSSLLTVAGSMAITGQGAFTSNYTVAATDTWLTAYSLSTTCVVTLPTPASNTGRMLFIRTQSAQLVNSASSNVTALATGAVGTAILSATAGKWALLFCDGSYWNIFAAN
jgi:hypothetical protein